jgi:hypothetical protein
MTITAADKHREARRELKMRLHVYPRFVAQGHLKQEIADRQIAVMAAIVEDYAALLEDDPGPLFAGGKDGGA